MGKNLLDIAFFIVFIGIAYGIGTLCETMHYRHISRREKELLSLPAVSSKTLESAQDISESFLVKGSVVISLDYFKRILAGLRAIFGGNISAYETLLDRGRREALLRMKEKAHACGADIILNTRFQTSGIGVVTRKKGSVGCFEVLAYGTAARLKKQ